MTLESNKFSQVHARVGQEAEYTVTGDGNEKLIEVPVIGAASVQIDVDVPAGATATWHVDSCTKSGQSSGDELKSGTFTAGQTTHIPVYTWAGNYLLVGLTSSAGDDLTVTLSVNPL